MEFVEEQLEALENEDRTCSTYTQDHVDAFREVALVIGCFESIKSLDNEWIEKKAKCDARS